MKMSDELRTIVEDAARVILRFGGTLRADTSQGVLQLQLKASACEILFNNVCCPMKPLDDAAKIYARIVADRDETMLEGLR